MTEPTDTLALAADFPPARREQWLKLVERVLRGAPFARTLVTTTHDGITIEPLYPGAAQVLAAPGRRPGAPWQILQRADHPQVAAANAQARQDLENGADGLSLILSDAIGAYGYGVVASEAARALADLPLDRVTIEFDGDLDASQARRITAALAKQVEPAAAQMRFGFDPLSAMARSQPIHWSEVAGRLGQHVANLAGAGWKGPFVVADGRVIHNAGGSEAQELAFVLAAAISYLRALEAAGVALDQARGMIYFRLAADVDQFLTIAKLRALRGLWAGVEQACGLAPAPVFISAETAWRMMTRHDPYVNMLRATIAVFAASLGGADAITVLPFTLARGLPDAFARRIARNTQFVLAAESSLAKVADAAAGAGVIEDLTRQLCAAAWTQLQDIERAGGAAAALESGLIQQRVALVRGERQAAVAVRADVLTGTSDFPDLDEANIDVLDVAPAAPTPASTTIDPLPAIRLAEPFEALRDAADRMQLAFGARPKIFLANLGAPADFSARAAYAKSFFEAGGIAVVTNDGFAPVSEGEAKTNLAVLVAAFKASGAKLACLCASDAIFGREASVTAKALTAAGAARIYAAGHHRAGWEAADIISIAAGCDALAILQAAQEAIAACLPGR